MNKTVILCGPHPYMAGVDVELPVWVAASVPGQHESARNLRRSMQLAMAIDEPVWMPLAGPYRIEAGRYAGALYRIHETQAALERWALISLLWDLMGRPICQGGTPRPVARIAVVDAPDGLTVYRDARECMDCETVRAMAREDVA